MKTEEIALSRVSENEANPRTITEANFQKLVKSILVFPKMLQLRPIVVDETYKALGGNMRTRALCHIVSMTPEAIMDVLDTDQRLTDAEKLAIANYWSQWKEQPTATIVKASDLTEAQKKRIHHQGQCRLRRLEHRSTGEPVQRPAADGLGNPAMDSWYGRNER